MKVTIHEFSNWEIIQTYLNIKLVINHEVYILHISAIQVKTANRLITGLFFDAAYIFFWVRKYFLAFFPAH